MAHRGVTHSGLPENCIQGFRKVVEENYEGVELDVRLSRDKDLVVFHDIRLERLTKSGRGTVRTKTLAELKELRLKSDLVETGIPTLEEVLDIFRHKSIVVNIEIKSEMPLRGKIEERVIDLVKSFKMKKNVVISSFNPLVVKKCQKIDDEIKTGFIYERRLPRLHQRLAKGLIVDSWHANFQAVSEIIVERARKAGCQIYPWTVNEDADIRRMIALGVDGIITDFPNRVKKIMDEL